ATMTRARFAATLAALVFGLTGRAYADEEKQPLMEKKVFADARGKKLPYRLLKPDHYDAKTKYPLVLFLHGAGERGSDNEKQLIHGVPEFAKSENRKKYPCFLVAPQCPAGQRWADWSASKQAAEPTEPLELVVELLKQVRT